METTYSLKYQRHLGAGEGFAVSFQQGLEGHAKQASVCGRTREQKGHFTFCNDTWAPTCKVSWVTRVRPLAPSEE